jgi:hypothetical protein
VGVDVHPGQVRDELLIAILLDVEDQQTLFPLSLAAIAPAAEEYSQFERHVESGQAVGAVELGPRQVVNAVTALDYDIVQLFQPHLPPVVRFPRRAGPESTGGDAEYERLEKRGVVVVEGAVDEDVVGGRPRDRQNYFFFSE